MGNGGTQRDCFPTYWEHKQYPGGTQYFRKAGTSLADTRRKESGPVPGGGDEEKK